MPRDSIFDRPFGCPECGATNFHLGPVAVEQGPKQYLVTEDGPAVVPRVGSKDRGSTIRVALWGECGHAFSAVYKFHKGVVYFEVERDVHTEPLLVGDNWPPTLWRD